MEVFFAAEEEADPVALVAAGDEATVVFEGAGVFDAVLVELPQEARNRGRIASAALRRRPLERNERKNRGVGHETTSQEGWNDILRLNIPEYLIGGQWKIPSYF